MNYNDLIREISNLGFSERIEVYKYLAECLSNSSPCDKMMQAVNRAAGTDIREINRTSAVSMCRMYAARWMRARGYSLNQIGKVLKRDHSTVINMLRNAEDLIVTNNKGYEEMAMIITNEMIRE